MSTKQLRPEKRRNKQDLKYKDALIHLKGTYIINWNF